MPLNLPERASYEYLKKLAKERLTLMREKNPSAKLAEAQLAIARQYGFSSWRALKAEMDLRRAPNVAGFTRACAAGDLNTLRDLLQKDPALSRERVAGGTTGLHVAVRHPEAVRLLIEDGADPNARDVGDNATPLHFAAGAGILESVRILLAAGADVHGSGDLHNGEVIGWAARQGNEAVVNLLLERGARHHILSAMALRDRDLVQNLVEQYPDSLLRRRSRFENMQTVVHAAFAPPDGLGFLAGQPDYGMLELLTIELGADIEATDDKGRTPPGAHSGVCYDSFLSCSAGEHVGNRGTDRFKSPGGHPWSGQADFIELFLLLQRACWCFSFRWRLFLSPSKRHPLQTLKSYYSAQERRVQIRNVPVPRPRSSSTARLTLSTSGLASCGASRQLPSKASRVSPSSMCESLSSLTSIRITPLVMPT